MEGGAAARLEPEESIGDGSSTTSIYAELASLLESRGWAQARGTRGRLTLDEALDELLGTRPGLAASGESLARAARLALHLRELTGSTSLLGWNDEPERSFDDVRELLAHAALRFPRD